MYAYVFAHRACVRIYEWGGRWMSFEWNEAWRPLGTKVKSSVVDYTNQQLNTWPHDSQSEFHLYCEESSMSNVFYLLLVFMDEFLGHPVLLQTEWKYILSTVESWGSNGVTSDSRGKLVSRQYSKQQSPAQPPAPPWPFKSPPVLAVPSADKKSCGGKRIVCAFISCASLFCIHSVKNYDKI